jgi:hypothetical protein
LKFADHYARLAHNGPRDQRTENRDQMSAIGKTVGSQYPGDGAIWVVHRQLANPLTYWLFAVETVQFG